MRKWAVVSYTRRMWQMFCSL